MQSASVVDEGAGLFIPSPVHPSRGANLVKVVKIGVSSNLSDSSQFGLAGQSVTSRQSVRCHVSWSVSHHVSLSICQSRQSRQFVNLSVTSVGQLVSKVSWLVKQPIPHTGTNHTEFTLCSKDLWTENGAPVATLVFLIIFWLPYFLMWAYELRLHQRGDLQVFQLLYSTQRGSQ